MAIKAKGRTIFRIIGSIFILIGLCFSYILSYFFFKDFFSYLIVVLISLPWILFSSFLKLELNRFTNNAKIILIILMIYSIGMLLLIVIWNLLSSVSIILNTLSILFLLICWHYSLSLYKKEKILFIFGGIFFITSIFLICSIHNLQRNLIFIADIIFVGSGIIMILLIETSLRKKGYLNYI
jgi:hypothetical protein